MDVADSAFEKAALAVGQVETPAPTKPGVESSPGQLVPAGLESLPPVPERAGVTLAEIEQFDQPQIGGPGHGVEDRGSRGYEAPRKYIALDEIDAPERSGIAVILDGNGLDQRQSIGRQPITDDRQIIIEEIRADLLDHLDRDDLAVGALELTVVFHQHLDPVFQA